MTSEYKRLSLNTTLKDARIFDDDSLESEKDYIPKIKVEPIDNDTDDSWLDDNALSGPIKREPYFEENTASPIKQERIDFEAKLKFETDESTNDNSCDGRVANLKTVRTNLKRRNVPYIKGEPESDDAPSTPKKRFPSTSSSLSSPEQKKFKNDKQKRRKWEIEKDSTVLKRRQKQIDYGKNTIGYDRYIQSLQKHQRKRGDPQTPDKYRKYSRRGWDGLIKQWRLNLHKYDPTEDDIKLEHHL